ncbi:MAG: beta-ketoacyl synthase [Bacteroidetes bacterium]|nr:beta-ketoacyl synthase [Bacteroidota bacterium]
MNPTTPHYIIDTSCISPLALGANENFKALLEGRSAIQEIEDRSFYPEPILAGVFDPEVMTQFRQRFQTDTRFDALLLACLDDMLQKRRVDYASTDTLLILSTTKGNIELFAENPADERAYLHYSANLLQHYAKNPNPVLIVSNACISGISACIVAKRYLEAGLYKHVLVIGCDVVTPFVLSGFSAFHAVSKKACKPFDLERDGVVLGEACGAILLSAEIPSEIRLLGGRISNDANHISGPSKTGEELAFCIRTTLKYAQVHESEIDFISAHGTATPYNDEMESKAIALATLHEAPVFSLKANFGHTLGAAGIIESIMSIEGLQRGIILPSLGFEKMGVSGDIKVNPYPFEKNMKYAVKTGSGFGGCNAALLLQKI